MAMWLNSRLKGGSGIKRELFATDDLAETALANVEAEHEKRGHKARDRSSGIRQFLEVTDPRTGDVLGKYWLSDEQNSPER
jgi:hypothetical protein